MHMLIHGSRIIHPIRIEGISNIRDQLQNNGASSTLLTCLTIGDSLCVRVAWPTFIYVVFQKRTCREWWCVSAPSAIYSNIDESIY